MHLMRLADREVVCGRDNLVLTRLRPLAEQSGSADVLRDFDEAATRLHDLCRVFREHRNKLYAHLDLETALQPDKAPPGYSRQSIEDSLRAVRDMMNAINKHYQFGETRYEAVSIRGDASAMLNCVFDGLRLREIRRAASTTDDVALRAAITNRNPNR
jgi:hypothetical protein